MKNIWERWDKSASRRQGGEAEGGGRHGKLAVASLFFHFLNVFKDAIMDVTSGKKKFRKKLGKRISIRLNMCWQEQVRDAI